MLCYAELKLQLLGQHQLDNAAAAIAAACVLRDQGIGEISQDSIVTGLQQTKLPGRLQVTYLAFVKHFHMECGLYLWHFDHLSSIRHTAFNRNPLSRKPHIVAHL